MSTTSFMLEVPTGSLAQIETDLRAALPAQIDVRLFPMTERTALLRGHLVQALTAANPEKTPADFFAARRVSVRPLDNDQIQARFSSRSLVELPAREITSPAQVDGLDWHLKSCRVDGAWRLLGGPDNIAWSVRVGQIDTGYTRHPALGFGSPTPWLQTNASKTFIEPAASRENWWEEEPLGGIDPVRGSNGGHGTRIAGTLCGYDRAARGGAFYGVAPRVPLVMTRVTDDVIVHNRQAEIVRALRYLVDEAGVDAINISLGFLPPGLVEPALKAAIADAYDAGVVVVCAAGNYVDPVVVPARLNRTIAVAGVTIAEVPWSGSSFGPQVDFSAPAADLRRANVKLGFTRVAFEYSAGGDGTSYATAMTTGAAALWLHHRRAEIATAYGRGWKRVAAFKKLARQQARVPAVEVGEQRIWQPGSFGTGILNVEAILQAELPPVDDTEREPLP